MNEDRRKKSGIGFSKEGMIVKSGIQIKGNTIDYALPHPWVKHMVKKYGIGFDEICGTSVMIYNKEHRQGIPMSYCTEIQNIMDKEFEIAD